MCAKTMQATVGRADEHDIVLGEIKSFDGLDRTERFPVTLRLRLVAALLENDDLQGTHLAANRRRQTLRNPTSPS